MISITTNIRNHLIVVKIVKNVAVAWILICFKNNADIVSMIWMYQLLPHPLMPQMYEMGHYFSESLFYVVTNFVVVDRVN